VVDVSGKGIEGTSRRLCFQQCGNFIRGRNRKGLPGAKLARRRGKGRERKNNTSVLNFQERPRESMGKRMFEPAIRWAEEAKKKRFLLYALILVPL